jgi:hypothetical protein
MSGVDRDRLAERLAAVGNHEGKALMFLAMEDGVDYGVSALHQRFLEIQGQPLAFKGTVNLQQKYVIHSFEPVGLAIRTLAGGRWLRHMKVDEDHHAAALAAHLLDYTESHPSSMTQIFGKTAKGPFGADRAPIRRVDAFRVLSQASRPISQADLGRLAGLTPKGGLTNVVNALHEAQLIDYESQPTFELKTQYRIQRRIEVPARSRALTAAVLDYLNTRLAAEGAFDVGRDEIEDHLSRDPRWEHLYIRDTLQRLMGRISDEGSVEMSQSYRGQTTHSIIVVSNEQRAFLAGLIQVLDKVTGGDEPTIRRGVRLGRELIASPQRVRKLLRRGFDSNKLLVNPVSRNAKQDLVLGALRNGPATSQQLTDRLQPRLNKTLVGQTLLELRHAGHVEGVAQLRSPQKFWKLTSEDR